MKPFLQKLINKTFLVKYKIDGMTLFGFLKSTLKSKVLVHNTY
jgi:hypothetical protein